MYLPSRQMSTHSLVLGGATLPRKTKDPLADVAGIVSVAPSPRMARLPRFAHWTLVGLKE